MKKNLSGYLNYFLIGMFLIGFLFIFFSFNNSEKFLSKKIVLAEDEHEDEDEHEQEDSRTYEPLIETYSQQVSDYVSQETVQTTVFDSDKDGIFDDEDKNPNINDFFIVKDDNLNGIVDKYE